MASVSRTSEVDELAKRLSSWAQREMGCEVTPGAFLELLLTPEMAENWRHIVKNMKSVNPQESFYLKAEEVTQPSSAELLWRHTQLCEEDSELDLNVAQLKKDLQLLLDIEAANEQKISKLESEVFTHSSKMQILHSNRSFCEKEMQNIVSLISEIETWLSSFPLSTARNSDSSQLAADIQEVLKMVSEYYESSRRDECAEELRRRIHSELRNMAKSWNREGYVDFFESHKKHHELELEKNDPDTALAKKKIECCFLELQTAHVRSFSTVHAQHMKVKDLESEKAQLMKDLADVVCAEDVDMYRTKLKIIRKKELTEILSDPKIPDGMPSLSYKNDLMSVQKQIEDQEQSLKNIFPQLVKACKHSRKLLDLCQTTFTDEFQRTGDVTDFQPKDLQVIFNLKGFNEKLETVENWLVKLNTGEPQLSDLSVRPKNRIIPDRIKVELLSALDMPMYEAPEMISQRVLKKMESFGANKDSARFLSPLVESLDVESCKQSVNQIFRSVEDSSSKAERVIAKADGCRKYLSSLVKCEGLRQCLKDFQEEPAFTEDIL